MNANHEEEQGSPNKKDNSIYDMNQRGPISGLGFRC
jgi:hypothetical protein